MNGTEYEQFVRAVLARRLKLSANRLISTKNPGSRLPGTSDFQHQIDLMYFQDNEIAEYITIIECKYRSSGLVDQPEIQNLAFVKDSIHAHKAIMITNNGFTSGANSVAESHRIALLVIKPEFEFFESYVDVNELFNLMASKVQSNTSHTMVVYRRFAPDPKAGGMKLIEELLSDPSVRKQVEGLLKDPGVRETANRVLRDNPDLAGKAMDFLKKGRW